MPDKPKSWSGVIVDNDGFPYVQMPDGRRDYNVYSVILAEERQTLKNIGYYDIGDESEPAKPKKTNKQDRPQSKSGNRASGIPHQLPDIIYHCKGCGASSDEVKINYMYLCPKCFKEFKRANGLDDYDDYLAEKAAIEGKPFY